MPDDRLTLNFHQQSVTTPTCDNGQSNLTRSDHQLSTAQQLIGNTLSDDILRILHNYFIDVLMYVRRPNRPNDSPMIRMNLDQIIMGVPDAPNDPIDFNVHLNTQNRLLKRGNEGQPSTIPKKIPKLNQRIPTFEQNHSHALEDVSSFFGEASGGPDPERPLEYEPVSSEDDLSQHGDGSSGRNQEQDRQLEYEPVSSDDDVSQYGEASGVRHHDPASDLENIESDDDFSRYGSNSSQDSCAENLREP